MVVPTLDEMKAFAAANGIAADMAEDFHNYCDAMGWRHNGGVIYSWRAMLKAWQRARKRFAAKDAKLTAHIDAKMDERDAAPSAEPPSVRARPEARSPVRAGARKFAPQKNHGTP